MNCFRTNNIVALLMFTLSSTMFLGSAFARNFAKRFDQTLNGSITSASNMLVTCDAAHSACSGAQNFTGSLYQNGPFMMVNVDADADSQTFNSSAAILTLPANSIVVFAGLYWGGTFGDHGTPHKAFPSPNPANKNRIKLKTPGNGYVTLSGSVDVENSFYQGFADVTNLISGSGEYWVANAELSTGKQQYGGWTLVVVTKSSLAPLRRVVVWDGFLRHSVGDLTIGLADTLGPRRDASSVAMNLVTYDGDKGASDSLRIDGNLFIPKNNYPVTDPAAAGDMANSTIRNFGIRNDERTPNYKNTLGYDADRYEIFRYLDTDRDVNLLFRTTGDIKHVGLITVQSDVEERFVQTDWSGGPTAGTSTLLDSETGFKNRTGHLFHATQPGNLRSVQFSYDYAGELYEILPVRSNTNDITYINFWLNNLSYPVWECNQSQFWLYREVDSSRVSWMHGLNGRFNCSGRLRASYSITGALSFFGSVLGQASQTGINASWGNQGRRGHLARFIAREFRIEGTMDSRSGTPLPEHSVTIDDIGTEVPYDWAAPAKWALTSDFDGRLESKVFDALVPRGFGVLAFDFSQTNGSLAQVFFRSGSSEADVLAKSWEGPFNNGDTLGSPVTNNQRFFQYAVQSTLVDPAVNTVESVIDIRELAFDFYGIASLIRQSTAGTWKRVEDEKKPLFNVKGSAQLLEDALSKKIQEVPLEYQNTEVDELVLELEEFDPSENEEASCSSTGKTTFPWFALLLVGMLFRRRKKD